MLGEDYRSLELFVMKISLLLRMHNSIKNQIMIPWRLTQCRMFSLSRPLRWYVFM
jgi:hypothetical protein